MGMVDDAGRKSATLIDFARHHGRVVVSRARFFFKGFSLGGRCELHDFPDDLAARYAHRQFAQFFGGYPLQVGIGSQPSGHGDRSETF